MKTPDTCIYNIMIMTFRINDLNDYLVIIMIICTKDALLKQDLDVYCNYKIYSIAVSILSNLTGSVHDYDCSLD